MLIVVSYLFPTMNQPDYRRFNFSGSELSQRDDSVWRVVRRCTGVTRLFEIRPMIREPCIKRRSRSHWFV